MFVIGCCTYVNNILHTTGYALDPGEIAAIAVGSIISLVVILAIIIILTLSFRYLWKKRTHIYMYNTRSSEDILQPNSQG